VQEKQQSTGTKAKKSFSHAMLNSAAPAVGDCALYQARLHQCQQQQGS
jgi:hypothetical protein